MSKTFNMYELFFKWMFYKNRFGWVGIASKQKIQHYGQSKYTSTGKRIKDNFQNDIYKYKPKLN